MSTHARRSNWPRLDILISLCRGAHSNPKNDTNICFVKESKCSEAHRRITQIPQQTYNLVIWKAPTTTSSHADFKLHFLPTTAVIRQHVSAADRSTPVPWKHRPKNKQKPCSKQSSGSEAAARRFCSSYSLPIHLGLQLSDWHTDPLQPATNFRTKQKMKRDPSKQREPVFVQPLSAYIHGHSTYKYIWSCPPCHVLQQEEHEICSVPLCLTGSNWDLVVEKKSC